MDKSLSLVIKKYAHHKNTLSPKVAKLQVHQDFYEEKEPEEKLLLKTGFINSFLCINARTSLFHTEMDSSYTIISVPNQNQSSTNEGKKNKGQFEFLLNEEKKFIIPMKVGSIITYSGYMITHRQQVTNLCDNSDPFINVVTYNSKRLFGNMLESFRRYIRYQK